MNNGLWVRTQAKSKSMTSDESPIFVLPKELVEILREYYEIFKTDVVLAQERDPNAP